MAADHLLMVKVSVFRPQFPDAPVYALAHVELTSLDVRLIGGALSEFLRKYQGQTRGCVPGGHCETLLEDFRDILDSMDAVVAAQGSESGR